MSSNPTRLVTVPAVEAFREFVRGALDAQRVETSELTEYYLVGLLDGFVSAAPQRLSRALGPELLAAGDVAPERRFSHLKDVADTSLFLSGVFLDHLERALPTTDYFFSVGSAAYQGLCELPRPSPVRESPFSDTFRELAERFEVFVSVLAAIADRDLFASDENALRIYKRWLSEDNGRDATRLVSLGLTPSRGDDTQIH